MSYDQKIEQARLVLFEHNRVAKNQINSDEFVTKLSDAGGTTEEALHHCTWEDLERCGLPPLIAKQVASIFRKKDERPRRVVTEAKAQAMTTEELFQSYDPRNPDNFIGRRLTEISKGKRCLVFNEDGSVNIEVSTLLLDELRDGYEERELFVSDAFTGRTYCVGEHPDRFANENPLFAGSLLRSDETCDVTNRSWKGIPDYVRGVLHLAVKQTKELRIASSDDAHRVLDTIEAIPNSASSSQVVSLLRRRYPKAVVLYDELKKNGGLPTLRLRKSGGKGEKNDPFYTHKRF